MRQLKAMMRAGVSLSGHERNVCFLNLGSPPEEGPAMQPITRFARVSATAGFDAPDDARGLATIDSDFDGDLDLWISNRTGPQVRFLRNDLPSGSNFVAIKLEGVSCNRDAIGARVEVFPRAGLPVVQTLRAGEGFLSQSSKWLHLGLGQASGIDRLIVRWPDGDRQEFEKLPADQFYQLRQGEEISRYERPLQPHDLAAGATIEPQESPVSKATLPDPIPLLQLEYYAAANQRRIVSAGDLRPLLLVLWTSQCATCLGELQELAASQSELKSLGLDVLALSIDGPYDAAAHAFLRQLSFPHESGAATTQTLEKLQLLHAQAFMRPAQLPVPFSFVIDPQQRLAAVYRGKVSLDALAEDVARLTAKPGPGTSQELLGGKWLVRPNLYNASMIVALALQRDWLDDTALFVERAREDIPQRDMPGILHRLGSEYSLIGKVDTAREYLEEVIRLDPDHAPAWNNLGTIAAGRSDFATAERCYRNAVKFSPEFATARENLATFLVKRGNMAEAIEHYQVAVELKPQEVRLRFNFASALAEARRLPQARAELVKVLDQKPDHIRARISLAQVLHLQGEAEAAEDTARRLVLEGNLSDAQREQLIKLVQAIRNRAGQ